MIGKTAVDEGPTGASKAGAMAGGAGRR